MARHEHDDRSRHASRQGREEDVADRQPEDASGDDVTSEVTERGELNGLGNRDWNRKESEQEQEGEEEERKEGRLSLSLFLSLSLSLDLFLAYPL